MRRLVLVAFLGLTLIACKKQGTTVDTVTTGPKDRGGGGSAQTVKHQPATDAVGATARDEDGNSAFAAVHFEFDSAQLSADGRAELERLATWMSKRDAKVTLEGHTDDRGTDEYNLALGERRSRAMRDYLVRLGVPSARIQTISYGEERPASSGDGDDAWAQNRRGEIVPR